MRTRNSVVLAVLVLGGALVGAATANAGVDVNVNLGIPVGVAVAPAPVVVSPQPVYVEEPPEMVMIPRSGVYFAPGVSVDLFFYNNRWWNRRGNRWYRASACNGPWTTVERRFVPGPVYRVPADYRTVYRHGERMPYGQWKKMHGGHGNRHRGHDRDDRHGHRD